MVWQRPARLIAFLFCLFFAQTLSAAAATDVATIITKGGLRLPFQVELADTPSVRARGLMFRKSMAPDAGMLFLFDAPEVASFWMKNTYLSLDMLFISADGTIADLYERATPLSTRAIMSKGPVSAVLEVLAGTVARFGIRPGDRVEHPAFTGG